MKKKTLSLTIAALTALSMVLGGCGASGASGDAAPAADGAAAAEETADTAEAPAEDAGDTTDAGSPAETPEGGIRLVNNKVEVDGGLKKLAAAYEKETGTPVVIESLGGGIDTQATLKGYYQAGDMPDIFVFEGDIHYPTWEGLLADLSGEEWVGDTEAEYVRDGKVYGFPTTTEAIGLAYNADILAKADIDPKSITGPESMRAAFEKLDSMKDELGLTSVVGYYTESSQLWWSPGQHIFGTYFDEGLKRDDTTYIDMFSEGGKLDEERAKPWAEMVTLFNEFTDPKGVSGTYDDQVKGFASGKYAFVTQGSWIGASLTDQYKDDYAASGNFEIGMIPYAFIEGQDTILTNSPNWWGVFNEGNVDAAKAFLAWCAKDDGGQEILAKDCGFISPYSSNTHAADDPFAKTIADYTAAGKTSSWHWLSMKEGIGQNATGVVFQDYAMGNFPDADTFLKTLEQVCESYYAN
ncbi:MAG: ABC transporter substrate-binding protein [Lachnospiraceae bacterium]|nr:ABC transporter substrate-binding protein [Lachnospiraceae bacterium]